MKIRNGFVSNSSSSSFAIIGILINEDKVSELIDEINESLNEDSQLCGNYDLAEYLTEGKTSNTSIKYACGIGDFNDVIYLGLDYSDMKQDETKKQFEGRISNELKIVLKNSDLENEINTDNIFEYVEGGMDN